MSKQKKTVNLSLDSEYKRWLTALKQKLLSTQPKAAVQVNSTLLACYWELGEDSVRRQAQANWGDGFLKQPSKDMMSEFPEIKGFSLSNIKYIRQWYLFYSDEAAKSQQLVGQLIQIPWGHNLKIASKCQSVPEVLYYVQNTLEYGWSRNVLTYQIENGLWQREGLELEKLKQTDELAVQQIEYLQERRTAPISAAVTGKIDVRDWVVPVDSRLRGNDDKEHPAEATPWARISPQCN